jgi:pimeloyl-ACP methyl ester carboxylesterase
VVHLDFVIQRIKEPRMSSNSPSTNSPLANSPSRFRPLVLAAALAAAMFAAPASATTSTAAVPAIDWGSCGDDITGVDCATVEVPLDYDQPNGPKTTLALARVPASDPARKIGTLFVNPGGPGGSGVDLVLFGFGDFLNQTLQGRFDIVGWDPRGIGASTPIQCWDSNAAQNQYFGDSPVFPFEASQERPFYELNRGVAALCFGRNQAIVRHMSTGDVVRDLDLLRRAVGDSKLNYLGYSYGSYIGNTYANLYPNKVRTLAIDGVLNPILWSSGWQIASDRTASFTTLRQFFRQCDLAGGQCALSGPSGSKSRFDQLLNFVRQTPILLDDGQGGAFVYSYDIFVADSAGVMYSPEIWPNYAGFLDALNDAIFGGDASAGTRALQKRRGIDAVLRAAAPRREIYDNGTEAFFGNHCSDAEYPSSFPVFSAIGRYAESGSFQGPFWWWGNSTCANWPAASDRYAGPWATRTSSPALVIGNFFDPATDYAGAVVSNLLLQNSRLLSYAGWGHTVAYSGRSQCVDDLVTRYFIDGTLPPRGTVCPAAPNPFGTAIANARSAKTAAPMPMTGLPTLKPLPKR